MLAARNPAGSMTWRQGGATGLTFQRSATVVMVMRERLGQSIEGPPRRSRLVLLIAAETVAPRRHLRAPGKTVLMAAKPEETVQRTIGLSCFMSADGFTRAPQPSRARSGIRRRPVPTACVAAQGFTLFGQGCFFAFERLARLFVAPAFRGCSRRSIRFASLARTDSAFFTLPRSSPPSSAPHPGTAARAPMRGASRPATRAGECTDELPPLVA